MAQTTGSIVNVFFEKDTASTDITNFVFPISLNDVDGNSISGYDNSALTAEFLITATKTDSSRLMGVKVMAAWEYAGDGYFTSVGSNKTSTVLGTMGNWPQFLDTTTSPQLLYELKTSSPVYPYVLADIDPYGNPIIKITPATTDPIKWILKGSVWLNSDTNLG